MLPSWGTDDAAYPGTPDKLDWGAGFVDSNASILDFRSTPQQVPTDVSRTTVSANPYPPP